MMTGIRWILGYMRLSGAKSASLQTDVFAQRYALVVVHATIVPDWIKYQAKNLAWGNVSEMTNFVPSKIITQSINQSINQPLCLLSIFNSYKYYIAYICSGNLQLLHSHTGRVTVCTYGHL